MKHEKDQEEKNVAHDETTAHSDDAAQPAYKKLLAHEQVEFLEKKLHETETKAQENWDKVLRSMAELENVKRRAERDVASAHKYAVERFAEQLIPVMDSLDQALLNCKAGLEAMREGLTLTQKMFMDVLTKFGVKVIHPEGENFDPNFHEAMMMQEDTHAVPNSVLTVVQKGYLLHDRLIRPARVIVAKAGS